jgi:glycosyltransferase involved in cell wall biosynthesis
MISVLMPVFNGSPFLAQAIESVLNQSYEDFEFIIVDDGSTDTSLQIAVEYAAKDRRIRCLPLKHTNISTTLNRGLDITTRPYIARMDADDISLPHRFQTQLDYLQQNSECMAVGSWVEVMDPAGWPIRVWRYRENHEQIDEDNLGRVTGPGLAHGTVMIRTDALRQVGGYREEYAGVEDWELWLRLAEMGKLANIPEVLVRYRQHLRSSSHATRNRQRKQRTELLREAYQRRHLHGRLRELDSVEADLDVSPTGYFRLWGWWALTDGNIATARKYALKTLVRSPWSKSTWTLTACTLLAQLRSVARI